MPPKPKKPSKGTPKPKLKPDAQVSQISTLPHSPYDQRMLDVYRLAFRTVLATDIKPMLQEVKQHLYNRDFARAFGQPEYLDVYAARWSPGRTLGYVAVLSAIKLNLRTANSGSKGPQHVKVLSLGGGAGAEIAAMAAFHACQMEASTNNRSQEGSNDTTDHHMTLDFHAVDIAAWDNLLAKLYAILVGTESSTTHPVPEPVLRPEQFTYHFHRKDLLKMGTDDLVSLLKGTALITLFFTLNELYSSSMGATQLLILNIAKEADVGTKLLVVDSPGSYSTVKVGKEGAEKNYPMKWLLEHTLLRDADDTDPCQWMKCKEIESVWFRPKDDLKYPIALENMRYQVHLYQKVDKSEVT